MLASQAAKAAEVEATNVGGKVSPTHPSPSRTLRNVGTMLTIPQINLILFSEFYCEFPGEGEEEEAH